MLRPGGNGFLSAGRLYRILRTDNVFNLLQRRLVPGLLARSVPHPCVGLAHWLRRVVSVVYRSVRTELCLPSFVFCWLCRAGRGYLWLLELFEWLQRGLRADEFL
jgi:hypothetical protein